MISRSVFEPVLAPLTEKFRREADTLLDLWECARQRTRPGRCVACYFTLRAAAVDVSPELAPLRDWLETHIEVVAENGEARFLEKVPLRLEAEDLESYCRGVMAEFHQNRVYADERIHLAFRYKDPGERQAA